MAAETEPLNGTGVIMQISEDDGTTWDRIAHGRSKSMSSSTEEIDITTDQSAGNKEIKPGKSSWSKSFEGLVSYNTGTDLDKPNDLYDLKANKTKIKVRFGSLNPGEYNYTGDCYITQYDQSAGVEDENTYSTTFSGTGPLTQAVVV